MRCLFVLKEIRFNMNDDLVTILNYLNKTKNALQNKTPSNYSIHYRFTIDLISRKKLSRNHFFLFVRSGPYETGSVTYYMFKM